MSTSARSKRLRRHLTRNKKAPTLTLTALMDVFTVLVFFLMFNSSSNQQPPENKDITLPGSTAETPAPDVVAVQISANNIIVQGIDIDRSISEQEGIEVIPELIKELEFRADRAVPVINDAGEEELELLILADRATPYLTIRRVMVSANMTPYNKISFAVLQQQGED